LIVCAAVGGMSESLELNFQILIDMCAEARRRQEYEKEI